MAEELSEEELKRLKREAAIRAKEVDFKKKQQEDEEAKRELLAKLKSDYDHAEQIREEEHVKALKRKAEIRAQKKKYAEKLNERREENIRKREEDWEIRAHAKIQLLCDEHDAQKEQVEQAKKEAQARRREQFMLAAEERLKAKERQQDLEEMRDDNLQKRALQTELKAIARSDVIKADANEEMRSFIENPFPVPLKQVLAGRLRPVPRVTELLASYKNQRESLADLEQENIALRAIIKGESLFQHVLGIRKDFDAEDEKNKPPMPVANDLVGGAGMRRKGSPKKERGGAMSPTQSKSGTSWKSMSGSPSKRSLARSTR